MQKIRAQKYRATVPLRKFCEEDDRLPVRLYCFLFPGERSGRNSSDISKTPQESRGVLPVFQRVMEQQTSKLSRLHSSDPLHRGLIWCCMIFFANCFYHAAVLVIFIFTVRGNVDFQRVL
jgi:hypothetical protein